jgi:hypothetical protein
VAVTDPKTGETKTESRSRTVFMCACYCMELTISTGKPT